MATHQELLCRGERIVIPEGRHKDYDIDLREGVVEELLSRGERSTIPGGQHKKDGLQGWRRPPTSTTAQ